MNEPNVACHNNFYNCLLSLVISYSTLHILLSSFVRSSPPKKKIKLRTSFRLPPGTEKLVLPLKQKTTTRNRNPCPVYTSYFNSWSLRQELKLFCSPRRTKIAVTVTVNNSTSVTVAPDSARYLQNSHMCASRARTSLHTQPVITAYRKLKILAFASFNLQLLSINV